MDPVQRSGGRRQLATLSSGCSVRLRLDSRVVGKAKLVNPVPGQDTDSFRRYMHGSLLSEYAKPGEDLVAIRDVSINSAFENESYPYSYGGLEDPPLYLWGLHGGIHSWDLRALLPDDEQNRRAALRNEEQGRSAAPKSVRRFRTPRGDNGLETSNTIEGQSGLNGANRAGLQRTNPQCTGRKRLGERRNNELRSSPRTRGQGMARREVRSPEPRVIDEHHSKCMGTAGMEVGNNSNYNTDMDEEDSNDGEESAQEGSEGDDVPFSPTPKRKYTYISRQRAVPLESSLSKRRKTVSGTLSDEQIECMQCCARLKCFQTADRSYLQAQMMRVLKMSQLERRRVLDGLLDNRLQVFMFNGMRVCSTFLERAFGFSRYLQARAKGTPGSTRKNIALDRIESRQITNSRDNIICYLERLAESTADRMPDCDEWHLPFFEKAEVYEDFVTENGRLRANTADREERQRRIASRSYFYYIWSQYCSRIKVRKLQRFTKCGDCERFRSALEEKRTDAKGAAVIKEKKKVHIQMVNAERREYAKKIQKTILYPQDYCSLIVDGADQSAFGLPHFRVHVKESRGHSIGVKLVGVLEHGPVQRATLLLMTEQYETGANHVIESIHRHLTQRSLLSPLPRTLFLQLDNSQRENKNQFLFAYVESLVAWGVFCEVYVSFLPIGHTHSDVDQMFSRTSTRLRNHDAVTMNDLMEQLSKSYSPQPHVLHMKGIINFSGLCRATDCTSAVKGFTAYRYFHFARSQNESERTDQFYGTTCSVRKSCSDDWEPLRRDSESGFLRSIPQLQETPPTRVIAPSNLQEIDRRLLSEESRIGASALRSLQELRDEIYCDGEEPFHWNLDDCLESNGRFAKRRVGDGEITEDEEAENIDPIYDLQYETNELVAVRPDERDDDLPFWIAKILEVEKNRSGVIVRLQVHWFELYEGNCPYKGKYRLADKNGEPWINKVTVNAVVHRFTRLARNKRLLVADEKSIWQALH